MNTAEGTGRSLELFFIDGRADGMVAAEVFNWTGRVLRTPRTQIATALKRAESRFTGVYILVGEKDDEPIAYIGEGEDTANRIRSHDQNKDWWTQAVLITTASNTLNKAHAKYLESRLLAEAKALANISLDNATFPPLPSLSESARSNMESFLRQLDLILPAIGIDIFVTKTRPSPTPDQGEDLPVFETFLKKEGIHAKAIFKDGEFIVLEGSQARQNWIGSPRGYQKLFSKLVSQGILEDRGKTKVFTQNYAFASTSAAAAITKGRNTAGPIAWKLEGSRKTYRDWEEEQLRQG